MCSLIPHLEHARPGSAGGGRGGLADAVAAVVVLVAVTAGVVVDAVVMTDVAVGPVVTTDVVVDGVVPAGTRMRIFLDRHYGFIGNVVNQKGTSVVRTRGWINLLK